LAAVAVDLERADKTALADMLADAWEGRRRSDCWRAATG
jgi:hypothetical protein